VTVEAGNLAGTDGTPPQVPPPPNSAEAGSEVESGRRLGVVKRMLTWMVLLVAMSVEG
jgi:hypothetical protein